MYKRDFSVTYEIRWGKGTGK